jgi:hypothetical protein
MFYDEKKSPYQYIYWSSILENTNHEVSLHEELKRIQWHKIFSSNKNIIDNYIKIYNIKKEIESIVFALCDKEKVLNISIWWSYLLKKDNSFSDIDLNVITKGSGFYYVDLPANIMSSFITTKLPCSKISIMSFGEDLFWKKIWWDFIITPNYLHRDLSVREWIVWSSRNINLYWYLFTTNDKNTYEYEHNLKCRIHRQLKFANFIYDWLFDHYSSEERIINKMASRIWEAWMYLLSDDTENLIKYSKIFIGDHVYTANELYNEITFLQNILSK